MDIFLMLLPLLVIGMFHFASLIPAKGRWGTVAMNGSSSYIGSLIALVSAFVVLLDWIVSLIAKFILAIVDVLIPEKGGSYVSGYEEAAGFRKKT